MASNPNLQQAREKATKLSRDIRHILSLLAAAQSLKGRINPRAANGLQELLDVMEIINGMTGRVSRDSAELDNIILLLCAKAQSGEPLRLD